jgi:hypothetical protein
LEWGSQDPPLFAGLLSVVVMMGVVLVAVVPVEVVVMGAVVVVVGVVVLVLVVIGVVVGVVMSAVVVDQHEDWPPHQEQVEQLLGKDEVLHLVMEELGPGLGHK